MSFSTQYLDLHRRFFTSTHAFPASAIAFLCHIGTDQRREWKPTDFVKDFGYTYPSCANTLRRLRLEGFVDGSGRITARGLDAIGNPPAGQREEVFS